MKRKNTIGWTKSKRQWATILGLIVLFGSVYFVRQIFHFKWPPFTGFEDKTLWNWLDLLVVPIILSLGAFFLNREQKRTELAVENIRNQNKILDEYIERISKLILNDNFNDKETNKNIKSIARTWTVTALSRLDTEGKKALLQFLDEAGMIQGENPLINLCGADLVETGKTYFAVFSSSIESLTRVDSFNPFAKISDSTIRGGDFKKAVLYSGLISRSSLKKINFSGADLRQIKIYESSIKDSNFYGSLLSNAEIFASSLCNVGLVSADLRNTIIKDSYFDEQSQIALSNLTSVSFYDSELNSVDFSASNLNFTKFYKSNINSASLSNTTIVGAIINQSNFKNTNLTKSNLSNSVIENTSFEGANLTSSIFSGSSLKNVDFSGTNLSEANLSKINLTKVNFKNADLSRANLTGAKIRKKQLQDAKSLIGATLPNGKEYTENNT